MLCFNKLYPIHWNGMQMVRFNKLYLIFWNNMQMLHFNKLYPVHWKDMQTLQNAFKKYFDLYHSLDSHETDDIFLLFPKKAGFDISCKLSPLYMYWTALPYTITITKTRLFKYIENIKKNIYFIFLLENIDCGYSLELPQWGSSNEDPQSIFSSTHTIYVLEHPQYMFFEYPQSMFLSTHNLCFRAKIRKIMYTPVNPSFTI